MTGPATRPDMEGGIDYHDDPYVADTDQLTK